MRKRWKGGEGGECVRRKSGKEGEVERICEEEEEVRGGRKMGNA